MDVLAPSGYILKTKKQWLFWQDDPLDLPFSTFYTNRKEEFDRRLEEIESSTTEELKEWITTKYKTAKGYGWSNSMLGWQTFENIDQLTVNYLTFSHKCFRIFLAFCFLLQTSFPL